MLLALDVPERTVTGRDGLVLDFDGRARYQHITDPIRHEVAGRVGGLLWSPPETD